MPSAHKVPKEDYEIAVVFSKHEASLFRDWYNAHEASLFRDWYMDSSGNMLMSIALLLEGILKDG